MDGKFRTLVPKGKFNKCCVYHKPPGYGVQTWSCSEVVDNTYLLYEIWATQGYLYTVPMVSPWGLLKFACMVKSQGH